jgi:hypothetical protein
MAERRNHKLADMSGPQGYEKDTKSLDAYKPLGQILIDKNFITPEQLDEALKIHWKRGLILGEILKQLGFLDEKKLLEALKIQAGQSKS